MNWIDGVILVIVAFGLVRGLFKGFFREAFQLLGIILAILIAFHNFSIVGRHLLALFDWPLMVANGVGFLVICLIVIGVCYFVGSFLRRASRFLAIRWLDSIGGGAFGVLKLALVLSILLNAFLLLSSPIPRLQERIREEFAKTSLAGPVAELAPTFYNWAVKILPGEHSFSGYQDFFARAVQTKEKIEEKTTRYRENNEMLEVAKGKIENFLKSESAEQLIEETPETKEE
jgi:membrane protein required for colicin V production